MRMFLSLMVGLHFDGAFESDLGFGVLPKSSVLSRLRLDEGAAFACAGGRVGPSVEFVADPSCVADVLQRADHRAIVAIAAADRHEGEWLFLPALQMDIGNTFGVLAHHRRDIAAGGRQMRGIGTEADLGLGEDFAHLIGIFDDRRQMRMVVGPQARAPWRCAGTLSSAAASAS